jgi:hypothetical protein
VNEQDIQIGDRVRILDTFFIDRRHLIGREGVVAGLDEDGNAYVAVEGSSGTPLASTVEKIHPLPETAALLDAQRVEAVRVAHSILGEVQEIRDLIALSEYLVGGVPEGTIREGEATMESPAADDTERVITLDHDPRPIKVGDRVMLTAPSWGGVPAGVTGTVTELDPDDPEWPYVIEPDDTATHGFVLSCSELERVATV